MAARRGEVVMDKTKVNWSEYYRQREEVSGGITPHPLVDVSNERIRQLKLWGEQNHDPKTWLGILTEEVGEVAREINDNGPGTAHYRKELIQVAAVAVAAVEALDRATAS